jgi:hypothetical protein
MSQFSDANSYDDLIECCHLVLDRCSDVDRRIECFGPQDAHRLAVADVQKHVAGLLFSLIALTRGRSRTQVRALFGSSGPSAEQGQAYTHDFWRFGLTTITHFRIDSMFQVILKARGEYKNKSAFTNMLRQILDMCELKDRKRTEDIFLVAAYLRNSFHNNGMHRGEALDVEFQDIRLQFEPGKAIDCGSFGNVLGVLYEMMSCLEEILLCPAVATLAGPISDDWMLEAPLVTD